MEKQLCAGAVARHVSSIGGHFYSDKRAWIRAGNDAGADANQSDDFDATSLDTNRNPYPDLCHDHRFGGKRSANVDQRLCIWSLSVAGDLYSAYCYELYRRWPCRSLRGEKGPALSALDGFAIGMGATGAMFVLGAMREIIGNGTLFDGADALLGNWAKVLRVEIFHTDSPFLLAMLPPGAFIGLGLMLAGKYLIDEKMKKRRAKTVVNEIPAGETGKV